MTWFSCNKTWMTRELLHCMTKHSQRSMHCWPWLRTGDTKLTPFTFRQSHSVGSAETCFSNSSVGGDGLGNLHQRHLYYNHWDQNWRVGHKNAETSKHQLGMYCSPYKYQNKHHLDLLSPITLSSFTLHAFADDNQLYIHCHPKDVQSAAANVEQCVAAIDHWMAANRLRLNPEKTELIWVGSKQSAEGFWKRSFSDARCSQH